MIGFLSIGLSYGMKKESTNLWETQKELRYFESIKGEVNLGEEPSNQEPLVEEKAQGEDGQDSDLVKLEEFSQSNFESLSEHNDKKQRKIKMKSALNHFYQNLKPEHDEEDVKALIKQISLTYYVDLYRLKQNIQYGKNYNNLDSAEKEAIAAILISQNMEVKPDLAGIAKKYGVRLTSLRNRLYQKDILQKDKTKNKINNTYKTESLKIAAEKIKALSEQSQVFNTKDVAKECGVSHAHLLRYLEGQGIKTTLDYAVEEVKRLEQEGKEYRLAKVADDFKIPFCKLASTIKKEGIKTSTDLAIEQVKRCEAEGLPFTYKDIADRFCISSTTLYIALYRKRKEAKEERIKQDVSDSEGESSLSH